jgi:hypothetical protein
MRKRGVMIRNALIVAASLIVFFLVVLTIARSLG